MGLDEPECFSSFVKHVQNGLCWSLQSSGTRYFRWWYDPLVVPAWVFQQLCEVAGCSVITFLTIQKLLLALRVQTLLVVIPIVNPFRHKFPTQELECLESKKHLSSFLEHAVLRRLVFLTFRGITVGITTE